MAAKRTGWSDLSKSRKDRLVRAGERGSLTGRPMTREQTRRYWARGGDLRGAEAGGVPRPRGAAPIESTLKEANRMGDDQTTAELARWRRSRAYPKWLPKSRERLGDATAAALSQLPPPPRWKEVSFQTLPGGTVLMTVQPRGSGYPTTITLASEDAMHDVGALIRQPVRKGETRAEKQRMKSWGRVSLKVNAKYGRKPSAGGDGDRPPSGPLSPSSPGSSPGSGSKSSSGGSAARKPKKATTAKRTGKAAKSGTKPSAKKAVGARKKATASRRAASPSTSVDVAKLIAEATAPLVKQLEATTELLERQARVIEELEKRLGL